ncbi:uncharacterized protein LAESUDRAFT_553599 [Laetiporus sulphureus 93-53]|uniref:Uncharacterized protein n=1 Tax=Laetiporus sulphureus 93-53 TaxID=1314785 RepID=A0A165B829_9APHY|nr:uncharacterized protein LAESUDRAFT_553599 [Laetiporus sulphureus 93-53]KZT00460.1 hypothetical protein LAESUDRAFT_553599 [Laetiporus sulphureus 93-53]
MASATLLPSPPSTAHRHKKRSATSSAAPRGRPAHPTSANRKLSRQHLLQCLDILGPLSAPLPPTLSLPPSSQRDTTPAKRKLDDDHDAAYTKKRRINDDADRSQPRSAPSGSRLRPEPSEEGELREEQPVFRDSVAALANVPVRRPRRGKGSLEYYKDVFNSYLASGRQLKHSAEKRKRSTYPKSHIDYTPLRDPPSPGSPYHRHGLLMARLENLESSLNFAYAFWARGMFMDRKERNPNPWNQVLGVLSASKNVWQDDRVSDERESMLRGLIYMIEGFVVAHKIRSNSQQIHNENEWMMKRLQIEADTEQLKAARAAALKAAEIRRMNPPVQLPSPISSAGSTPASEGTPNADDTSACNASAPISATAGASRTPVAQPPPPKELELPPPHITIKVNAATVQPRREQSHNIVVATNAMEKAERYITLPAMAKHFPRTFARMMYSSLAPSEEYEPDIEDEEGELFWPGQCATGEGIAWVCTMGKAMIQEFSKAYGYKGIDGAIPDDVSADGVPTSTSTPDVSLQR